MNFPGHPATPTAEPTKKLTYVVDFNATGTCQEMVRADYFSTCDGLITFWEDRDGKPRDHFVIGYPIARIRAITPEGDIE